MRLIRGLSVQSAGIPIDVTFASHMFRLNVAAVRLCFHFSATIEIRCLPPESQEPHRQPHVDRAGRDEPDSAAGSEAPPPKSQHSKSDGKAKAMGIFSKDIKTLDDLFVHTLRDIYCAEQQIEKVLPKMIDKATDPQLKAGFEKHLGQTKGHIQRVEEVFELHGIKARGVNCPAIDGILVEAEEVSGRHRRQGSPGRGLDRIGAGGRAL